MSTEHERRELVGRLERIVGDARRVQRLSAIADELHSLGAMPSTVLCVRGDSRAAMRALTASLEAVWPRAGVLSSREINARAAALLREISTLPAAVAAADE